MSITSIRPTRRGLLQGAAAAAAASSVPTWWAIAQAKPLKLGLMLPYSGTYAKLGENITYAVELLPSSPGPHAGLLAQHGYGGTPEAVCYGGGAVNVWLAKRFIKVPFISLVNLIMGREVDPS